ncbi:transposase [Nitrosomonas sp.]|uniref:transposase n=1 Tax=Nitrosomonas sp. TaxID=42353 RepID=UPI0025D1832D|nr:transposase [Nitrosomonas sp.]
MQKANHEVVGDREEQDNEPDAQSAVIQPGADSEACSIRKAGKPVFGYKQHTVVDSNGLVMAATTTAANCHDSKPLLSPRQSQYPVGTRVHTNKAYSSQKHRAALKSRGIKNGSRLRPRRTIH